MCLQQLHLSFASIGLFPLYCVNNQHDFKGWAEKQRIMSHDKKNLIFDLTSSLHVESWFQGAWSETQYMSPAVIYGK